MRLRSCRLPPHQRNLNPELIVEFACHKWLVGENAIKRRAADVELLGCAELVAVVDVEHVFDVPMNYRIQ